jgi:hypothetical protein
MFYRCAIAGGGEAMDRVIGEVLSINRQGDVTVRVGDKLIIIGASEAEGAGMPQPGDRIEFETTRDGMTVRIGVKKIG